MWLENLDKLHKILNRLMEGESLRESAERIGVSYGWLRNLKIGKDHRSGKPIKPRPQILERIATVYHYPVQELLELAGYMEPAQVSLEERLPVFKERLYSLIKEKELSLDSVCEKADVSREKVLDVLDGSREFGFKFLYKIAHALDVTPDYLTGFTNDPQGISKQTPKPIQFTDFLKRNEIAFGEVILSEEDKERVTRILTEVFYDAHRKANG